jgi:hypothetical protein
VAKRLAYGEFSWELPDEQNLEGLKRKIEKTMKERSVVRVTLKSGDLILNGATIGYIILFDDAEEPQVETIIGHGEAGQ